MPFFVILTFLFAGLFEQTRADECETLLKPVVIDGLKDIHFIGRSSFLFDEFWGPILREGLSPEVMGLPKAKAEKKYEPFQVVVYDGDVKTKNGTWIHHLKPFYHFEDKTLYLSHQSLKTNLSYKISHSSGWIFILAHEMAHHVQNHLGVLQALKDQHKKSEKEYIEFRTRLELQADCLAGVWTHHHQWLLSSSETSALFRLCRNLGDGNKSSCAYHGSGAQRKKWFAEGFSSGDLKSCNTFSRLFSEL